MLPHMGLTGINKYPVNVIEINGHEGDADRTESQFKGRDLVKIQLSDNMHLSRIPPLEFKEKQVWYFQGGEYRRP